MLHIDSDYIYFGAKGSGEFFENVFYIYNCKICLHLYCITYLCHNLKKSKLNQLRKKYIYFKKKLCNVFTTTLIISDKNFCWKSPLFPDPWMIDIEKLWVGGKLKLYIKGECCRMSVCQKSHWVNTIFVHAIVLLYTQ